ncbi:hypothetical protein [Kitasatospora purpeofusca]|uniref:hypothetical protein n=1 Tax=Kitasatospora purpeofusca TaxID=67352 RepID=UPI0038653BAB|nr:hypothetical protein OIP63_37815 [Kitasatospora purpeofusca]
MPFDVFSAIGAMVRAEATRTTEPAPCAQPDPAEPSDPGTTAHPAEARTAPHPLQEPTAGAGPRSSALPPAAPLMPGLSA